MRLKKRSKRRKLKRTPPSQRSANAAPRSLGLCLCLRISMLTARTSCWRVAFIPALVLKLQERSRRENDRKRIGSARPAARVEVAPGPRRTGIPREARPRREPDGGVRRLDVRPRRRRTREGRQLLRRIGAENRQGIRGDPGRHHPGRHQEPHATRSSTARRLIYGFPLFPRDAPLALGESDAAPGLKAESHRSIVG